MFSCGAVIMPCIAILTFSGFHPLWMKSKSMIITIKATEPYRGLHSCGAVYYAVKGGSNV